LKFFFNYDDWDLFIYQFQVTDIIQHWDGDGPYTQDVFRRIDKLLGEFVRMLPEDAVLIMASDHGSREYSNRINLNTWLDHMGLIAKDLKGNLDSRNSIAYHMDWGIYINKSELKARWSAVRGFKPESEETVYDNFLDYLIAQAKAITATRMIEPLVIKMWRSPAVSVGPAPDLVVAAEYREYAVEPNDLFQMGQNLIDSAFKKGKKFHHRRTGMFIAMGKGIKKGYKAEMQDIFDITPTVLYLLGLPQADYFDGKVMESIFEEDFLAENLRQHIASYSMPVNKAKKKDLNREKLEEKLRAIGYVQ